MSRENEEKAIVKDRKQERGEVGEKKERGEIRHDLCRTHDLLSINFKRERLVAKERYLSTKQTERKGTNGKVEAKNENENEKSRPRDSSLPFSPIQTSSDCIDILAIPVYETTGGSLKPSPLSPASLELLNKVSLTSALSNP